MQLAYILGRHGLALNLEDGPAAVADDDLREQLAQIMRWACVPGMPSAGCGLARAARPTAGGRLHAMRSAQRQARGLAGGIPAPVLAHVG